MDAIIINPHGDIDKAIERRDWFIGFASAVSFIEHFGIIKIRSYVNSTILQRTQNEENKKK